VETQPKKFLFKQIFRKVFLEDWVMKLVALAITFALWFGVTGLSRPTTQRLTSIPLSVRYSNNIEVTNSPIQEVNLVVSGDSRRLAQINENDLIASIDISDVAAGDRVIPLTPETVAVSLPTGVKLDEIQPRSMAVRIETVEEKEVPVKPESFGEIPAGYEVYGETVSPAKVRVRGPSGFLRTLESVPTERVDLTNRVTDFTARQVPVSVLNPKATVVSESLVDVAFRIGEVRVERVLMVPLDDGSGRRARVVLRGGRSIMEEIEPSNIEIEVYKNEAGRDATRAKLSAEYDGRIEVRSVELRG
jgi:YbbR domain-containing protein